MALAGLSTWAGRLLTERTAVGMALFRADLLTRGDIATACIQYGRFPSFLSIQKVALGRSRFRLLLLGVRQRLRGMPPERRPKVLVFGESLDAWSSSDVVRYQGNDGFDHYGIDTALWVGLPGLAKWSRNGMARGRSDLVPPGTVRAIDHPDELHGLSADERDRLRAVILSHDYRADMARTVHTAYARPQVTDGQFPRVAATLCAVEIERARRIEASEHQTPPDPWGGVAPTPRRVSETFGGPVRVLPRHQHPPPARAHARR